ncbi:MAG: ParB/RepB/Spo0J family partition protein [Oscillospiraceae bacterium]|nr:ParB/RepB/Spo0J family partition protein [Oscillospiraceae bacterium]
MNTSPPKAEYLPIDKLRPFEDHPFQVKDDDEMDQLVFSVLTQGLLTPITVRATDTDEYEVISGHRRLRACPKAGIETVPALIYSMDRDAAIIALVDSNLHRERLLPSEKAHAYKMKMDATSHQGKTSRQVGEKWSVKVLSEAGSDSERQRYRSRDHRKRTWSRRRKYHPSYLRTPDCPGPRRGTRCSCRSLLRLERSLTFNAPDENFHILVGGSFLFFSAIINRVAAVRRAALPRTIYVRTGLGAGSLNKHFNRMGTSRHCLPRYFFASFMPYRGIAPKCMRFLHWIFYKYFPMSSASIT